MSTSTKPQSAPRPGATAPTWETVVQLMESRAAYAGGDYARGWWLLAEDGRQRDADGAAKYSVRHQHDNGRDHAVDGYQEHLDACCYWWAEWQATQNVDALELFTSSLNLAHRSRLYLFRRDGR